MTSVLARRGTGTAPVRVRSAQTQVSALARARKGDKTEFKRITQLGTYEMVMLPSSEEIEMYTADQLYEMSYGGSHDYWRSPVFSRLRDQEREYVSDLIREINVVESIYNCPVCNYDRILVRQEQKGGGDESMTTMFRCTKCGHPWSNSGRG